MSYNINVENAKKEIWANSHLGYESEEYRKANDNYFRTMEKEIAKGLENGEWVGGWLDLEDPSDVLGESVFFGEDKDFVEQVFNDYMRFKDLEVKYGIGSGHDEELVKKASEYIKC